MKVPNRIYITEADDEGENLLAWRKLTSADEGRIFVYELVEELDKRDTCELRRKGSKKWFRA